MRLSNLIEQDDKRSSRTELLHLQQRLIDDLPDEFDVSLESDDVNDFVKVSCNAPNIKINVCMMPARKADWAGVCPIYWKNLNSSVVNDDWVEIWYQPVVDQLKSNMSVLRKLD